MNIAIITARGGSKRIPRKNIRPFHGKPMIAWPINAALESGCFDHVLVSTEDEEIASIAREYGAEVPYLRPVEMADDYCAADVPARHMLEWAMRQWGEIQVMAHIYPTAPLLTAPVVQRGVQAILNGKNLAYAARKLDFPIYQVVIRNEAGQVSYLFPWEKVDMRSQDMPQGYIGTGQLYCFNPQKFLSYGLNMPDRVELIEIPTEDAIDIDTEEDWRMAEKRFAEKMAFSG